MKSNFLFLPAGILLLSLKAIALSVSILGVQDSAGVSSSTQSVAGQSNYGGGVLLNQHIGGRWTISTGAFQFTRGWTDTTAGANNTITSTVVMVPLTFNFHFHFLSIGAGGYYSQNSGTLNESGTTTNSSLAYGNYAGGLNSYDDGYVGRLDLHLPVGHLLAIQVGAMYLGSASNLATNSNNTWHQHDTLISAGVTIPLGGGNGYQSEHQRAGGR